MARATPALPHVMPADADGIAAAVALLAAGDLVAVATETVYGLAADAANPQAVARIFAAKGRPAGNPLIVHVADRAMAETLATFPQPAGLLADRFWPGPLTLVLPLRRAAPIAPAVTAGLATVALRVPAHRAMQAVIAGLGRAVAAPSANASGQLSPTRADHVVAGLGGAVPLVLDAGPCAAGIESSILGLAADGTPRLLRHGAVALETIEQALGRRVAVAGAGEPVAAPGMQWRHYAPRLPLRLDAVAAGADEFHLGFGTIAGDASLSPAGDLHEAAGRLFDLLHAAESSGRAAIAVAPIPAHGLGAAINDRLARAARG